MILKAIQVTLFGSLFLAQFFLPTSPAVSDTDIIELNERHISDLLVCSPRHVCNIIAHGNTTFANLV